MLTIVIPGLEYFNEETEEFTYYEDTKVQLEHSLVSISKWEAKWCKPGLNGNDKTMEEIVDNVKCMAGDDSIDFAVFDRLTERNLIEINDSPEAVTFCWDVSTVPVPVEGMNQPATVVNDSTRMDKGKLKIIEDKLYGTESAEPTLPLPDEIKALLQ